MRGWDRGADHRQHLGPSPRSASSDARRTRRPGSGSSSLESEGRRSARTYRNARAAGRTTRETRVKHAIPHAQPPAGARLDARDALTSVPSLRSRPETWQRRRPAV